MAPNSARIHCSSTEHYAVQLSKAQGQFRRACDQIVVMNRKLDSIIRRYRHARRENLRSYRYPLRLRLAVAEGVRNMFYDYAVLKAEEVEQLRDEMRPDMDEDDQSMIEL